MGVTAKIPEGVITQDMATSLGETLLSQIRQLRTQVDKLEGENAALKSENTDNAKLLADLEPFKVLLEDPPEWMQVLVRSPVLCELLIGRTMKVYGIKDYPDRLEDKDLRRRARMYVDRIVEACLRHGLNEAWDKVYTRYLSKGR